METETKTENGKTKNDCEEIEIVQELISYILNIMKTNYVRNILTYKK